MARNMDTPTGTSHIVKLLLCNLDIFLDKYRTLARNQIFLYLYS